MKLGLIDGWSRDSLRGEVTYEIGEVLYEDHQVRPMCIYITPAGTRPGREYLDSDVVERNVFKGRYKAVLECFTHTPHDGDARYYFLAADAILAMDPWQLAESPELERQAMQKAWRLGWVDLDVILGRCFPEVVPLYAAAMTQEQVEQLLWYAMSHACWEYDLNGLGKEYTTEHDDTILSLMALAFPAAAESVAVFGGQILKEVPGFWKRPDLAKKWVMGLVEGTPAETFELPSLG